MRAETPETADGAAGWAEVNGGEPRPPYSRRFKVAHIITQLELGGAQLSTLHIVKQLDRARFDPVLITNELGVLNDEAKKIPGVEVIFVPELVREISPIKDMKTVRSLTTIMKRLAIDIVHTHSSKAGIAGRWAARRASVPLVFHTVEGWSFHQFQSRLKNGVFALPERICAKGTDRFITVSDNDRKKGLAAGIGQKRQYVTIRSGVDCRMFVDAAARYGNGETRSAIGLNPGDFVVGQMNSFKWGKNNRALVDIAERVVREVPNAKFLIVGDGVEKSDVERRIREKSLDEYFILPGWRRDVERFISVCDVITLTTLHEGLPQVCAQAMCCRKPMVMHAVDGIPEALIDGENGYLVEPGDVEGFAEKLIRLANDPGERERMGERGLSMVYPEWDGDNMVRRIEALYHEVLVEKGLVAES